MPGTDPAEAMRIILGELPGLPHLAELPARGPGAGLTGRTAALLVDLPVETTPGGWRFASQAGPRPQPRPGSARRRPGCADRNRRRLRRAAENTGLRPVDTGGVH